MTDIKLIKREYPDESLKGPGITPGLRLVGLVEGLSEGHTDFSSAKNTALEKLFEGAHKSDAEITEIWGTVYRIASSSKGGFSVLVYGDAYKPNQ